jgi:3-oxoacyl-[acyl-carrier-protein] synthase II
MRRRVVVTGIGAVSAAGSNAEALVEALRVGRRCFTRLDDPRIAKLRATHAALVEGLEPNPNDPPEIRALDRNVHLSLLAMRQAVNNAGLGDCPLGPRAGIVFGTCSGGMLSIEKHYEGLVKGTDLLDSDLYFSKQYYTGAKVLAWAAGASGPALSVITACAAGAGAIAQGADLIRANLADIVVAGGSDTLALSTLAGFDALKATCEGMCAPFSTGIGLNLGEGSGFWVLEDLERAAERNAVFYAELLGAGLSNDAYHPTAPDPSTKGQVAAMERALDDAGAVVDLVDYVNAHGTGTRSNDPIESRAIAKLLGQHADRVPVSSTKSIIGHCLGGAGALEASAAVLAARAGFVPPTAGFDVPRVGCALPDYVSDVRRPWKGRITLSNSFGFGGNNACLLIDVTPVREKPATGLSEISQERPVITGVGVVSPLGAGVSQIVESREQAIFELGRMPPPVKPFLAGCVPQIDPKQVDRRLDLKGMDLCSQYATMAARSALGSAGIKLRPSEVAKVGMILGLATGPTQGESDHLNAVFESDFDIARLGAFPYVVPNEVAGHVARALMLRGHNTVITAGQGSGLAAVVSAAIAVEQGHASTVIAAGADELTERTVTDGYRVGLWGPGTEVTPGEGAAALTIESARKAEERNAPVLAEIAGYGLTVDSGDPRSTSGESLARAVITALDRANARPEEIRAIATGRRGAAEDALELSAIDQVFGNRPLSAVSLAPRIGFAEATLPLFNLAYLMSTCEPGSLIAAVFLAPQGFASAVVLRVLGREAVRTGVTADL